MKRNLLLISILVTALVVGAMIFKTPSPTAPGDNNNETPITGGCFVGGCSSQICSDNPDVITTCEFRAEYACYRTAECKRQENGQCGWTETAELQMCLANPPPLE